MSLKPINTVRIIATIAALLTLNFTLGDAYNHLFVISWPGHARFHYAWFTVLTTMLVVLMLVLLWKKSQQQLPPCRLACLLGLMIWVANVIAGLLAPWYQGVITFKPSPIGNYIVHAVMIVLFFGCWLRCTMLQKQ